MKRFSGGLGERLEIASIQQLARSVLFLFVCVWGGGALARFSTSINSASEVVNVVGKNKDT